MNDAGTIAQRILPAAWNALTEKIIGAAIEVHAVLGPGLLEKLYEDAMCIELHRLGLPFARQRSIQMIYKGEPIGDLRIDLVVQDLVIVELKSTDGICDAHRAQLLSYLRSADLPLGLLINFKHARLVDGVSRRINPHASLMQKLPTIMPSSPLSSAHSASSEFPPKALS